MYPTIHSLAHSGTTQGERLMKALIPENLLLDDRNMSDLLAFTGKYATQIRFWSATDAPDGDWTGFFENDATSLFALVAATDLDELRAQYRAHELAGLNPGKKKKDASQVETSPFHQLVGDIYQVAVCILETCTKLPENHPLKAEARALIREKLGVVADVRGRNNFDTPIGKLVSYHKSTGEVIALYEPFFMETSCARAWGLTRHDYLTCIDFSEPLGKTDREPLWRLFLEFYKVLTIIVGKAEKALSGLLHSRNDHPPHIALLLAFLLLFRRYHQSGMNNLVSRHLLYYYRDVLRLQERREIPDRVHLVFKIAEKLDSYRLDKGIALLGGKDVNGIDRLFALQDELVLNQAQLVEKQNVYYYKYGSKWEKAAPVVLPKADTRDGVKTPFPQNLKAWHPLSGMEVLKREYLKKNQAHLRVTAGLKLDAGFFKLPDLVGRPGFILSSRQLWLTKSRLRVVFLEFAEQIPAEVILKNFEVGVSTNKSIAPLSAFAIEESSFEKERIIKIGFEYVSKYQAAGLLYHKNNIALLFDTNFPEIVPLSSESDLYFSDLGAPSVFFIAKTGADHRMIEKLELGMINISVHSNNITNLAIQLGSTQYSSTAEIPLMGSYSKEQFMSLYVTAPELSVKEVSYDNKLPSVSFFLPEDEHIALTGNLREITTTKLDAAPNLDPSAVVYGSNTAYKFYRQDIKIGFRGHDQAPFFYKIPSEGIALSYSSVPGQVTVYQIDVLGGYRETRPNGVKSKTLIARNLMPEFDGPVDGNENTVKNARNGSIKGEPTADGNLRLGFEKLQPGQSLSLLFKFADGTGNPDHIAPDEIVWSYLRKDEWVRIPQQYIILDETLGLSQTGIVRIQVPADINNQNTWSLGAEGRKDLYWLQASASEIPEDNVFVDALPMLEDIHTQAATAVFQNRNNDLTHLEKGLSPGSVTQLRYLDSNVTNVGQPYVSFGGRLSEDADRQSYYRRISERLRHRQRAVSIWDYERLTLENFPDVSLVKCLSHTEDTAVNRPGYVTLGVVPYPDAMIGDRKYYPIFDAGNLVAIRQFLNRHSSYVVSGKGGGVVCCCTSDEQGCGCGEHGNLLVRNALFEPVQLQVCVKFRKGKEVFFYRKQLNEDLKNFLAPWAADRGKPLSFGMPVYKVDLLRFLENLDYVDVVMGLKVKHFPNRETAEENYALFGFEETEVIRPFTSRSVLTTYLDLLNEDNPNVSDHEINLITDDDCCAGCP